MNKLFYSFAIFCCALQVGIGLFIAGLFYRAGFPLYQRTAFLLWFYWSSAFFFMVHGHGCSHSKERLQKKRRSDDEMVLK